MEKRAVEVFVPAINKYYIILIPSSMKVGLLSKLVVNLICEHESINIKTDNLIMGSKDTGKILEDNLSIANASITDGSTLVLI